MTNRNEHTKNKSDEKRCLHFSEEDGQLIADWLEAPYLVCLHRDTRVNEGQSRSGRGPWNY